MNLKYISIISCIVLAFSLSIRSNFEQMRTSLMEGTSFLKMLIDHQVTTYSELLQKQTGQSPLWNQTQCQNENFDGCTCYEIMNVGEKWLMHIEASDENNHNEHDSCGIISNAQQKHAAKLNNDDTKSTFKLCSLILCSLHHCQGGSVNKQIATKYSNALKTLWTNHNNSSSNSNSWTSEINELNKTLNGYKNIDFPACKYTNQDNTLGLSDPAENTVSSAKFSNIQISSKKSQHPYIDKATIPLKQNNKEKTIIFLDNSSSFKQYIQDGHMVLDKIWGCLDLSETQVHLIGGKIHNGKSDGPESTLLASSLTNVDKRDITMKWKGNGFGTYLWQYAWETIRDLVKENQIQNHFRILFIVDGLDNTPQRSATGQRNEWSVGFVAKEKLFTQKIMELDITSNIFAYVVDHKNTMVEKKAYQYAGGSGATSGMDIDMTTVQKIRSLNEFVNAFNAPLSERKRIAEQNKEKNKSK